MRKAVTEGERQARRLLNQSWWDDEARDSPLPVVPKTLAESLGIKVEEAWLEPDESGRIVIPRRGQPTIQVNVFDHVNRQRFTCAHEIGHYIRRRQAGDTGRDTFVDYRNTLAGLGVDREEIFANQFAAALLMPKHIVRQARSELKSADAMGRRFGTSVQALELRLRNLGLS